MWLVLVGVTVVIGCKKDYKDAPYPFHEIVSFKIGTGVNDTLKAAITGDSVVVYWSGFKTVPDSVTPVITVSENARVFPASGQKVALKTGTTFTVMAQDSSKTTYKMYLKVYQDEPVMSTVKTAFNLATAWTLNGFDNLIPDTGVTRLYIVDAKGKEIKIPLTSMNVSTLVTQLLPVNLVDTGYYKLKLVNNIYTKYSGDSAIKVFAQPEIISFSPVKGTPGEVVTITGKHFSTTSGGNTVLFNGLAASIVTTGNTELKVIVPEGAGTGKLSVTARGYTGLSTNVYTVLSAAATIVTTVAGNGNNAIVDGVGTAASFRTITGLTIDGSGNIYVLENGNHIIRKVTPSGSVGFFAGSGVRLFADGVGAAASFDTPSGIVTGNDGQLYVADYWTQRIRKVGLDATVTTFAGSGVRGFADGSATTARFSLPRDITTDANGNFYVSDNTNQRIRKIAPNGDVSTLAGSGTAGYADGTGTAAQFRTPYGLAVDAGGNVYVAEQGNHCIRKITPDGVVTTLAGSPGVAGFADGAGATALFSSPSEMVIDAQGNLYVVDYGNHRIRRISPEGKVITWAGSGQDGFLDGAGSEAMFSYPRGIAIDAAGALYVTSQNRIRKITPP
jgi:uncharacterized protein (TIGR03437 family)